MCIAVDIPKVSHMSNLRRETTVSLIERVEVGTGGRASIPKISEFAGSESSK
jgi:hypothetical protein